VTAALGGIDPLLLEDGGFDGFDYPETLQKLPLLDDGTSETGNEVLQNSGMGFAEAAISGYLDAAADVVVLRGYGRDKSVQTFTQPDETATHQVVVSNVKVTEKFPGELWRFTATLIQLSSSSVGS
jgi:hypothetical protein